MRPLYYKWCSILALLLLASGSYLYILYLPWNSLWLDGKEFWYTLHWKGEKVGYVQINYRQLDDDIFQITQLTRVKTTNRGRFIQLTEKEVYGFDTGNSGVLSSVFYHRQLDDYTEQMNLVNQKGYLQGTKITAKQKIPVSLKVDNYQLSEFLQLNRWALQSPSLHDTLTTRQFDLKALVLNPVVYQVLEDNEHRLRVGFQLLDRDWKGIVELSKTGIPQHYSVGRMVEQRLSSRQQALSVNSQVDYYYAQIIPIDKALGDADKLNSLTLATTALPVAGIANNQRQSIDDNGILYLKSGSPAATTDGNDALIKPFEIVSDNQTIYLKNLAISIVGDSTKISEKVAKLLSFVADYIEDYPVIRPMTITNILQQQKGDCTEHTRLFNALAQALSIPAREVKGLIYLGDEIQGFGGHVWSEIVIDGQWIAVDATWDLQQLGATHIEFSTQSDVSILNEMHSEAGISFKVISMD